MDSPFVRQAWTLSAVLLSMVGQGMLLSFTTSLLPALQEPHSPIKADLQTASRLASSCGWATLPGYVTSSVLMDMYGRRFTHLIVLLPATVGWLAIYFAQNIPTLLLGRTLGGFTGGCTVFLGAIVIGEYSSPKYRGLFLNLKTVALCLGGMIMHIMAHCLTWRTIALICTIPYMTTMLLIYTWPESPAWLASRGEFEKSKESFIWLRGQSEASLKELDECIKAQMQRLSKPNVEKPWTDTVAEVLKKFTRRDFLMPLFIVIIGTSLLEASGRHIFPAFALQMVGEVTGDESHSLYYTFGIDIIIIVTGIVSSILVNIYNRRTLLFSTGFAAVAVVTIACTYLFLAANQIITNDQPWIPMGIFVVFFILANLGSTAIPLALLGEVLPLAHRGVGSAAAGIWMALTVVLGFQFTPYLLLNIKIHGTFFIFGAIMGISLLILYFILPETKDKTLQEIENYFNLGRYGEEKDEEENIKIIKS